ncbi:hypothetical protein [Dapis sp. BLCC M172]|uniref:hypothetical protein n=1 Tax=Dapis sp. BLCC M172 TaxID=2975281 RepID=UPI003CF3361D
MENYRKTNNNKNVNIEDLLQGNSSDSNSNNKLSIRNLKIQDTDADSYYHHKRYDFWSLFDENITFRNW